MRYILIGIVMILLTNVILLVAGGLVALLLPFLGLILIFGILGFISVKIIEAIKRN